MTVCTEKPPNVKSSIHEKFDMTHLHRVRHAVVIVALINLGEKVLTQLKKPQNKQIVASLNDSLF